MGKIRLCSGGLWYWQWFLCNVSMSEKFPKKTESSGRKPWFSDRSFYEYVREIAMKNISIKGILLSIFIILESGYYFLNPDGFRFLFPVERVFFIFSFLTGTVLLVSLILYKKKIAFVCLILCSIYLFCAVLCLFLFHISLAERVLGILSFSILLLWIFFIWKDLK